MRRNTIIASVMLLGGCYASFTADDDGGGPRPDAGSRDAAPPVEFTDAYELRHETIPAYPWLDAPPSGSPCWPVSVSPRFSEQAVSNLAAALETWRAPCTRFCFEAPRVRDAVDDEPSPAFEGIVATVDPEFVEAVPSGGGANSHGLFGDVRTESATLSVGPGRTPSVREWARAVGLATGLRLTDPSVASVLTTGLPESAGATPADRGALCRHYSR